MNIKNKVYIIAEAGVNHNGNLNIALEIIEKAKESGANCVKFQTFKADQIVTKKSPKADYQLNVTDKKESQYEMLQKLELKINDYEKLIQKCKELEIDFMSTPYNFNDVDFLYKLGVNSFKVASGQLTELPFLQYIGSKMKTTILSTGMSNIADVFNAVKAIRDMGNEDIIALQCTTNYPSKIEDANLLAMLSIREACKVRVGYSDHVENNYACFASVAIGAEIVEKHFTLDKNMPGPDHSSSLIPSEFKNLVNGIREIEKALGNGLKIPTESESKNIFGMKRSIVALNDINEGEVIDKINIGFKRPANGLSPNYYDSIIGKKTLKKINKDDPLQFDSIVW